MFRDAESFATAAACAASPPPDPFAADPRAAILRAAAKDAARAAIAVDAMWLILGENTDDWSAQALANNAAHDLMRRPAIVWG